MIDLSQYEPNNQADDDFPDVIPFATPALEQRNWGKQKSPIKSTTWQAPVNPDPNGAPINRGTIATADATELDYQHVRNLVGQWLIGYVAKSNIAGVVLAWGGMVTPLTLSLCPYTIGHDLLIISSARNYTDTFAMLHPILQSLIWEGQPLIGKPNKLAIPLLSRGLFKANMFTIVINGVAKIGYIKAQEAE